MDLDAKVDLSNAEDSSTTLTSANTESESLDEDQLLSTKTPLKLLSLDSIIKSLNFKNPDG